jgi:thiosulfate/3-mercaptopyruvate sulfurtransferase
MKIFRSLIISIVALFWANLTYAFNLPGPLVETDWLAKNQGNIVILDIRKDVKSFTKKPVFKKDKKTKKLKLKKVAGHIPGSILVNYKNLRGKKKN